MERKESESLKGDVVQAKTMKGQLFRSKIFDSCGNSTIHTIPLYSSELIKSYLVETQLQKLVLFVVKVPEEKTLEQLKAEYLLVKQLGDIVPFFFKVLNIETVEVNPGSVNKDDCIELLAEYGIDPILSQINKYKATDLYEKIIIWMIQSFNAFRYAYERRVHHLNVARQLQKCNPENLFYDGSTIKIELLGAHDNSSEKDIIDEILQATTKEEKINDDEALVYRWGMTFYSLISGKSLVNVKELRNDEKAYNDWLSNISKEKEFSEIDPEGTIANVIAKCIPYNVKDIPKLTEVQKMIDEIKGEFYPNSIEAANLYTLLGNAYYDYTAKYEISHDFHEKALKIMKKVYDKEHLETADVLNNIAMTYSAIDNNEKALEYHNMALKIREKFKKDVAVSYNNIGAVYNKTGDVEKAIEFHQKALEDLKNTIGLKNNIGVSVYSNLGNDYKNKGDYSTSLSYYEKAREIALNQKEKDLAMIANLHNSYGNALYASKEYGKGMDELRKALDIYKQIFGEDHLSIADCYFNIANAYMGLGKIKLALSDHNNALSIRRRILGEKHLIVADSYYSKGLVLSHLNKVEKALKKHKKAFDIRAELLGKEHINTAMSNIAFFALSKQETLDEKKSALVAYEESLKIFIKENISNELSANLKLKIIYLSNSIGDEHVKLKKFDDAHLHHKKALNYYLELSKEDADENAAIFYFQVGREAISCFEESLKIRKQIIDNEYHVDIADCYYLLGKINSKTNEKDKAHENFIKAKGIYIKLLGEDYVKAKKCNEKLEKLKITSK